MISVALQEESKEGVRIELTIVVTYILIVLADISFQITVLIKHLFHGE
jgi:hypothetical protein